MEENIKTKRMRKVSSWMTDAVEAINNEDEILAGKGAAACARFA